MTDVTEISGVRVTTAGTVKQLFNRLAYFFVDQYGAVGDGVTDDTAFIQAAFDACGMNGGGVVFFPKGRYLISGTITWPNVAIWAQGSGGYGANVAVQSEILVQADGVTAFHFEHQGCKVTDLSFIGLTTATSGDAINCWGIDCQFRDCTFKGFFNGLVTTQNEACVIDGCQFYDQANHGMDTSNSVSSDNGDSVTSNCVFSTDIATPVAWYQLGSGGQKIHGCKFVSTSSNGFGNVVQCDFPNAGFNTSDLLISNCSIEQFTGFGIVVTVGAGAQFFNIILVGNQIGSYQGGKGIQISASGGVNNNNVIVGNSFNQSTEGIVLVNVGSTVISGNLFDSVGAEVVQAGTNALLLTGLASNDQGAPPVNTVTPVAWADWNIYSPSGATVLYKVGLYQ